MPATAIIRRLEDGWEYQPSWRLQVIESYLLEIAATNDRKAAVQKILFREKDPVVRQGLRFRMNGVCAGANVTKAFEWTFQCARGNARTGILSMVKAMLLAGLPTAVIAKEVGTSSLNIVVAERVHFDVRRYLENRLWLRSVVVEPHQDAPSTPEMSRERMSLSIAFESGAERLLKVLRGGEDASEKTLEATAHRIEAIAGRRALEYVRRLDREGLAANEDDLKRYVLARGMRSREAATTASEQQNQIKAWGLALVRTLDTQNKAELDEKTVRDAARVLPIEEMKEIAGRQIEASASEAIAVAAEAECGAK